MATATSLFLQKPSLQWKNNHLYYSPVLSSFAHFTIRTSFTKLSVVKCSFTGNNHSSWNNCYTSHQVYSKNGSVKMETRKISALEIIVVHRIIDALGKAAAALLVGLLLMLYDSKYSALAASGGRMGGSSFSSRTTSTSSSQSSYRASSTARGSSVMSSSHKSYSDPSTVEEGSVFSYCVESVPYHEPSRSSRVVYVNPTVEFISYCLIIIIMIAHASRALDSGNSLLKATQETSVLKLQVGLLGSRRSLQKDLNRIAINADTSTPQGLHYVLTETVLALLRRPDYCISSYSSVDVKGSTEEGEKRFNQFSIEERSKFDEETLVNFNDMKKQSSTILRASGFSNGYIVITILVAAEGAYKLPSNNSTLKEVLQKLASIPSSRIMAVEVLWTPRNEDDTLSERELLEDYPLLRPL